MNGITISPATDEEVRSGDIGRRLRHFKVVRGLRAIVALYWFRLEVLFVDEAARGASVGSALLAEGERIARGMGAVNATLETFEFQAPAFYARHGYVENSRIEGYAGGYYLALMTKTL